MRFLFLSLFIMNFVYGLGLHEVECFKGKNKSSPTMICTDYSGKYTDQFSPTEYDRESCRKGYHITDTLFGIQILQEDPTTTRIVCEKASGYSIICPGDARYVPKHQIDGNCAKTFEEAQRKAKPRMETYKAIREIKVNHN